MDLHIERAFKKAVTAASDGDHKYGSALVERIICWLDLTALKGSWHQVESRGRKEQSVLIGTKGRRGRSPNKSGFIVDQKSYSFEFSHR